MKTIILTSESIIKNAKRLTESVSGFKLPKFIFKRVKDHNTSLGDNEAFPPTDVYPFDYSILKKRLEEVTNNISKFYGENLDVNYLSNELSRLLKECVEIEKPFRKNLETLCENIIYDLFSVPSETVNFKCSLVDKVSPSRMPNVMPEDEDNRNFDFEDLEDYGNASKIVLKRRLINSLIQGASYEYAFSFLDHKNELDKMNGYLCGLYERIIALNDYLLFNKQENITDKHNMQGGYVEVMLGRGKDKTEITAQGMIFPYLLHDSIRGFMELFASHGLPKDVKKANYIIGKADFLLAEPWDLRLGVGLWSYFGDVIDDTTILPYFFSSLCAMQVGDFNDSLREVFASTKKGQSILRDLYSNATRNLERQDFISTMKQKNSEVSMINDNYISADELDDYVIEEDSLTENEMGEYNDVYHSKVLNDENCPLLDKVFGNGFTIREMLNKFYDFEDRINYACKYLEPLGKGIRRTVFALDDKYVLKLTNGSHTYQTQNEYNFSTCGNVDILPRIIYQSQDFTWSVIERAFPLTDDLCEKILGVDLYDYDEDIPSLDGFQKWAEAKANHEDIDRETDIMYGNLLHTNPFFEKLYKVENLQRGADLGSDLRSFGILRGDNLGVVNRNGNLEVVFVDGGFLSHWGGDIRKLPNKAEKVRLRQQRFKESKNHANKLLTEVKPIGGCYYMAKSQIGRNNKPPKDVYERALEILREYYPNYEFTHIMYDPNKERIRFDYSNDFDSCTEPEFVDAKDVYYNLGYAEEGKHSGVWHHRQWWVDDDYEGFDLKRNNSWTDFYGGFIKKYKEIPPEIHQRTDKKFKGKPMKPNSPIGGSRASWLMHLMWMDKMEGHGPILINRYMEENNIEDPIAYLSKYNEMSGNYQGKIIPLYQELSNMK